MGFLGIFNMRIRLAGQLDIELASWISGEPAGEPAVRPGRGAGYISHSDPKQGVLMVIQLPGAHKCTQSFFPRRQLASLTPKNEFRFVGFSKEFHCSCAWWASKAYQDERKFVGIP